MSTNHSFGYPGLKPLGLLWFPFLLFSPDSINIHIQYSLKSYWWRLWYLSLFSTPTVTILFRVLFQAPPPMAIPSQELPDGAVPLVSAPSNLARTPSPSHHSGLLVLMGGKLKTQLVFMALNNLVTNLPHQSYSPLLPSSRPPPPHLCPCTQPFPLLHSVWLSTKAQVRHISPRKIALATRGERVALTQIAHLVISNVAPCDLFYSIYCFYCYSNINWLICLFN